MNSQFDSSTVIFLHVAKVDADLVGYENMGGWSVPLVVRLLDRRAPTVRFCERAKKQQSA